MFRRHPGLQKWTKAFIVPEDNDRASPIFKIDFHTFYYSFLVGVAANERADDISDATDMFRFFPDHIRPKKNEIIAVLIHTYTKDLGIKLNDKESLKKMVSSLIDVEKKELSGEGYKRANQYAYRGFEIISEKIKYPSDAVKALQGIIEIINSYD